MPALPKTVRRALGRTAASEPTFQRVNPDSPSWSDWMLVSVDMLWEAVWFDRDTGSRRMSKRSVMQGFGKKRSLAAVPEGLGCGEIFEYTSITITVISVYPP